MLLAVKSYLLPFIILPQLQAIINLTPINIMLNTIYCVLSAEMFVSLPINIICLLKLLIEVMFKHGAGCTVQKMKSVQSHPQGGVTLNAKFVFLNAYYF